MRTETTGIHKCCTKTKTLPCLPSTPHNIRQQENQIIYPAYQNTNISCLFFLQRCQTSATILETLRSRFFDVSREPRTANREPRTSRSHVTSAFTACRQVCSLMLKFLRLDHALEVSDLPQGFLLPKTSQSHV